MESPERDKKDLLWVEPFSLPELVTLTRKAFKLNSPGVGIQYIANVNDGYVEMTKSFSPVSEQYRVNARFVALFDWTWDITKNPTLWVPKGSMETQYHLRQITAADPEEWGKLEFFFRQFVCEKHNLAKVKKVEAIHNPILSRNFDSHLRILWSKHLTNPQLFKSDHWRSMDPDDPAEKMLKFRLFDHFSDYVDHFPWNKHLKLPVVCMLQGSTKTASESISENGFSVVATLDPGYYGKGIYFTHDLDYAMAYGKVVIVSMIIPGNIFPITKNPWKPGSYLGKPLQSGYQSHYTVVSKSSTVTAFPVSHSDIIHKHKHASELVIFDGAQALPMFILHF